jgi:carboxylesterase
MVLQHSKEELRNLAQPFFYKSPNNSSKTLIILTHGFTASATEIRPLAEFLKAKKYDTYGILLAGHGTTSTDLDTVHWKEWLNDINMIFEEYAPKYNHVFLGGVSLGGGLSLYLASKLEIDGVFTINALYKLSKMDVFLSTLVHWFKLHKPKTDERNNWYLENNLFSYPDDSVAAAYQIIKFLRKLRRKMKKIKTPTLIIQSQTDKTISPETGELIYNNLKTKKEILRIPKGDHILTVDPNRKRAFEKIGEFIEKLVE